MNDFQGKVALVTGAAGGIGAAVVRALRARGARVAVADRDTSGIEADAHLPGDLLHPAYADGLPAAAVQALGRLDIVVNNAGVITRGQGHGDLRRRLDAIPRRERRGPLPHQPRRDPDPGGPGGGAIVNTASCWGLRPGPNHAVYCMTKAALASLTQCMGTDHAHQGIRINAVCPNEVNTPMLRTRLRRRGFDPDTAISELGQDRPPRPHRRARGHRRRHPVPRLGRGPLHVRLAGRGERRKGRGMTRFAGKVALVTGGRMGIGQAIARRLRDDGARVSPPSGARTRSSSASRPTWPTARARRKWSPRSSSGPDDSTSSSTTRASCRRPAPRT